MTPQFVSNCGLARSASWERRVAAVLEIIGVFVAGTLLARLASRGLNLGPVSLRALAPDEEPDFLSLSRSTAANLLLRYGFVLSLAFVVGWWHRRRRLAAYGVTTAGRRVSNHVIIAVLLFAAAGLPALGLKFLADVFPLGPAPQHWALTQALDRPGIWLYLFVGSFGLVPIVEELFARGYVQSRLAEDFGAPPAILMTALFLPSRIPGTSSLGSSASGCWARYSWHRSRQGKCGIEPGHCCRASAHMHWETCRSAAGSFRPFSS